MEFQFIQIPHWHKWIVLAPRRAKRPDVDKGTEVFCPFCPGNEENDENLDVGNGIRVLPNKFPFAPIHELIIHSPDHHKNIDELPNEYVIALLRTYKERYVMHQSIGQVVIFHNRGIQAGESVPHAHTQLAVVPSCVAIDAPVLSSELLQAGIKTNYFHIFAPKVTQWPDEVWIAPLRSGKRFGEINDEEISDLASSLPKLIRLMSLRHGEEFPFNYCISSGINWYLRFIPRQKSLGGFEIGTGIYVNTQDPAETDLFLQKYFNQPEPFTIAEEHKAGYRKHA